MTTIYYNMDKLTRSLIGKYECVIQLHSEMSHAAVIAAHPHIDLEEHIKRTMAHDLARRLLDNTSVIYSRRDEPENIVFTAKIIAMSEDDITTIVNAAYQAGLDSQNT